MNKNQMRTLLISGLLPVVAFTVIESWQGPVWGTMAALIFGVFEILYERKTEKKVSQITLVSNAFVFALGIVSILTAEGIWFKLQPALLVALFGFFLIGTSLRGTPLLVSLAEKQNPNFPPILKTFFVGLNFRLAFFMFGLTALSVHAALSWSTPAWAALKGVGVPLLMGLYLVIEILVFRLKNKKPIDPK